VQLTNKTTITRLQKCTF